MLKEKSSLAFRTNSKKFQFVGDAFKAVFCGNLSFNFSGKAFLNFDDFRTFGANQVVMVAIVIFTDEFKPPRAIAEIKTLDHAHFFQQVHGAIDGGKIAWSPALLHFGKNFPVGEGVGMFPQNFQDCRTGTGDFAGLSPQTILENG